MKWKNNIILHEVIIRIKNFLFGLVQSQMASGTFLSRVVIYV